MEFEDPPERPSVPGAFSSPVTQVRSTKAPQNETSRSKRTHSGLRHANLIINLCLATALFFLSAGWFLKGNLPDASTIVPELRFDPKQTETSRAPFDFTYKGNGYTVEPLADYDIAGLLVTHNNPAGWGDIYHDDTSVDFRDLCLIWGSNVIDNNYQRMEFWSESWTCYMKATQQQVYEQFDHARLSNNHLLSADPAVERTIQSMRRGDQVWLKGMLVSYYPTGMKPYARNSSMIRTDRGNGACEVLYVEDAAILKRGPQLGFRLYTIGWWLFVLSLLAKIWALLVVPLKFYRPQVK